MNKKYTFYWTAREDYGVPNNNYNPESDYVVCEPPFDFGCYISDYCEKQYEQEENTYYILDENGERTGECYMVVSEEDTDEEI